MRHFKSLGWVFAFILAYILTPKIVAAVFYTGLPVVNVSPNRATAGAYSFEVVTYLMCFLALIGKVAWALAATSSLQSAWRVIKSKTAIASLAIGMIVFVGGWNRAFWWLKHMYTNEAYNHVEYTGAVNSTLIALAMISLVFAVFPRKKIGAKVGLSDFGSDRVSLIMLAIGLAAFIAGAWLYAGRP
jgi:hypothetical protein